MICKETCLKAYELFMRSRAGPCQLTTEIVDFQGYTNFWSQRWFPSDAVLYIM